MHLHISLLVIVILP